MTRSVEVLLSNGANPNCATWPSVPTDHFMRDCRTRGETPLHRAAAFGSEVTIQMLLDAGARLGALDMNRGFPSQLGELVRETATHHPDALLR